MFLLFATSSSKRMPVIDIGLGLKQFGARWSSCWRMAALKAFTTSWETLQERYMQHRQSLAEGDTDLQSWKQNRFIITGWWFGTFFIFPFSWECHHPN